MNLESESGINDKWDVYKTLVSEDRYSRTRQKVLEEQTANQGDIIHIADKYIDRLTNQLLAEDAGTITNERDGLTYMISYGSDGYTNVGITGRMDLKALKQDFGQLKIGQVRTFIENNIYDHGCETVQDIDLEKFKKVHLLHYVTDHCQSLEDTAEILDDSKLRTVAAAMKMGFFESIANSPSIEMPIRYRFTAGNGDGYQGMMEVKGADNLATVGGFYKAREPGMLDWLVVGK